MLLQTADPHRYILYIETVSDQMRHFDRLFKLWEALQSTELHQLELTVDFNYCEFLGHNGVAFLGGLATLVQVQGGRVNFKWESLQPKIYTNLAQNGFLYGFGANVPSWDGNSIPFRVDTLFDQRGIIDYLQYYWLGKGWVNISRGLQQVISGQASEIYLNAFDHSQSEIGVFSCGQHYPKLGVLQLTVVDFGIGIAHSVRSLPQYQMLSTQEALLWAFQSGNTTQQQAGISRGLGLNLLQEFVMANQGSLLLYSNDGCICIDHRGLIYQDCSTHFAGTLVNIALQCDESLYRLEADPPHAADHEAWF